MFISGEIFKNGNNTRKKSGDDALKPGDIKEEFNSSKNEMQNSEVGLDKQVVQGKKLL